MSKPLLKFIQLAKLDEATHTAWGIATAEVPDKDNELCDYAFAKASYQKWSTEIFTATTTAGQEPSLGNIRVQHTLQIGGKATKLEFNDDKRQIWLGSEPVDERTWELLKGGFLTGYSQGGSYEFRRCNTCERSIQDGNFCPNCKKDVIVRYGPSIAEVSYVDNPCLEEAHFALVKEDGSTELRKFQGGKTMATAATPAPVVSPELVQKVVEALVKREADAKTPAERFKAEPDKNLVANIKKNVDLILAKRGEGKKFKKGMYEVGCFADLLCQLAYLRINAERERGYEGDASTLPEDLQRDLEALAESFLAMAEEETEELTTAADLAGKKGGLFMNTQAADLQKAAKNVAEVISKMHKAVDDHHEKAAAAHTDHAAKMHKMHKDHTDEMNGHIAKLHKSLGTSEEPEGTHTGEPSSVDPQASGTPNTQKGMTADEVKKAITDAVSAGKAEGKKEGEEQLKSFLVALLGGEEAAKAAVAKASVAAAVVPGLGDRAQLPTVVAGGGPVIKVVPISKTQDTVTEPNKGTVTEPLSKAEVAAAVLHGDAAAGIKLMRSAVPKAEVPPTLVQHLSKFGK